MPSRLQKTSQMAEVNCCPQSDLNVAGMPSLETQPMMKALAHVEASVSHWYRLYPPGSPVFHGEQVRLSQGRGQQGTHQVNMDVAELPGR